MESAREESPLLPGPWTVMPLQIQDAEFFSVLQLDRHERYRYFVKRVIDEQKAWGLMTRDEWLTHESATGARLWPLWPHVRFALHWGASPGSVPVPLRIPWSTRSVFAPTENSPVLLSIFPTADDEGLVVERSILAETITVRLATLGTRMETLNDDESRAGTLRTKLNENRVRRLAPAYRSVIADALDVSATDLEQLTWEETERLQREFARQRSEDMEFLRLSWAEPERAELWITLSQMSDRLPPGAAEAAVLLAESGVTLPGVIVPVRTVLTRAEALFRKTDSDGLRLLVPDGTGALEIQYWSKGWDDEYVLFVSGVFAASFLP